MVGIIVPDEGYKYLTDGVSWATEVWLSDNANPNRWHSTNEEPREVDMDAEYLQQDVRKGSYFTVNDGLYKALENIPMGGKVSEGINCQKVSVADALNEERSKE